MALTYGQVEPSPPGRSIVVLTGRAAARPGGADPGTLAAAADPVADRRLLRLLRAGAAGDRGFAGAAITHRRRVLAGVTSSGPAGGPYLPTLLALREGPLLEQAVRALPTTPEVLLVNATGRDHPRRAGLALHLGAVLGLPTVGVIVRPLVAEGSWPADRRGAMAPLRLGGEVVGCWVRTRAGAKPVAVHAAWRTDAQTAVQVVLAATRRARTPEPLRRARARTLARTRRTHS